jgi:hypothetical protein
MTAKIYFYLLNPIFVQIEIGIRLDGQKLQKRRQIQLL